MKIWVVMLLVGLALLVLISPGLIGQFAERSVDENIRRGTVENDSVIVNALTFDRGWFTSEGQHRIEIKDGALADRIRALANLSADVALPVITVTTRIDHGVIPVASMGRDDGSLLPGLGDAISMLSLTMPDGATIDLPGAVHTRIGLTGATHSTYALPAGEIEQDGGGLRWSDGQVEVDMHAATNRLDFSATLESLEILGAETPLQLAEFLVEGTLEPGSHGFALGDIAASIGTVTTASQVMGPVEAQGGSSIEDGQLALTFALDVQLDAPGTGPARAIVDLDADGVDPEAFGRLLGRYRAISADTGDPATTLLRLEPELQALLSHGLAIDIRRLELVLPDGMLEADLTARIRDNEVDAGNWAALLLATTMSADIRADEPLMATLVELNPDAGALIGMGYLKADGDAYVTEIQYAKGILTINGAPLTIPLP